LIQLREEARNKDKDETTGEKPGEKPKKFVSLDWLTQKQEHLKKTGRRK